jgi:arylsulfatase A-like enzyme
MKIRTVGVLALAFIGLVGSGGPVPLSQLIFANSAIGQTVGQAVGQAVGQVESRLATTPNILLIIADDVGIDASPCYSLGAEKPDMPVLESLCQDGVVFDNVWAYPVCSPTRASIITGRYGFRTGVLEGVRPRGGTGLPEGEISLHRFLDENAPPDYAHAVIGKWHLSDQSNGGNSHPEETGVGHYAGMIRGAHRDYFNWQRIEGGRTSDVAGYSTSVFTDEAIEWIGDQQRPWFLWLAYTAPHTPFHLPPEDLHGRNDLSGSENDIESNPRSYYFAAMEALDTEIGRLLGSLLPEVRANTVVMFIGDNGSPGQVVQSPFERRRSKGTIFEGGVHVPLVVAGAGVSRASQREAALINSTDLFATISEIAGIDLPSYEDSVSFAPLLGGGEQSMPRNFVYTEFETSGDRQSRNNGRAIRDSRYKLIELDSGDRMLYDLTEDPAEQNNLLSSGGSAASEIAEQLAEAWPK